MWSSECAHLSYNCKHKRKSYERSRVEASSRASGKEIQLPSRASLWSCLASQAKLSLLALEMSGGGGGDTRDGSSVVELLDGAPIISDRVHGDSQIRLARETLLRNPVYYWMQLEIAGLRHEGSKREKRTRSSLTNLRLEKRRLAPGRTPSPGLEVASFYIR